MTRDIGCVVNDVHIVSCHAMRMQFHAMQCLYIGLPVFRPQLLPRRVPRRARLQPPQVVATVVNELHWQVEFVLECRFKGICP